jgi:hypothetical protein
VETVFTGTALNRYSICAQWTLAAYQDFLTLWKYANPNIPILKQAKAEYAKLAIAIRATMY